MTRLLLASLALTACAPQQIDTWGAARAALARATDKAWRWVS